MAQLHASSIWKNRPPRLIPPSSPLPRAPYSDDLLKLVFIKRYILILLLCSLFVFKV